jgi:hypothetical protein
MSAVGARPNTWRIGPITFSRQLFGEQVRQRTSKIVSTSNMTGIEPSLGLSMEIPKNNLRGTFPHQNYLNTRLPQSHSCQAVYAAGRTFGKVAISDLPVCDQHSAALDIPVSIKSAPTGNARRRCGTKAVLPAGASESIGETP